LHIVREQRRKVLIRAKMRAGGQPIDVCIRDISSKGLMIQAHAPPARGTYVEIVGADYEVVGRVVWVRERRFGIRTREPMNILAMIGGAPAGPSPRVPLPKPGRPAPAVARQSAGSSRALGKAMEFAMIGAFAAALAAALVSAAYTILSHPLESVSTHLEVGP
jgi:hypothetical protein